MLLYTSIPSADRRFSMKNIIRKLCTREYQIKRRLNGKSGKGPVKVHKKRGVFL